MEKKNQTKKYILSIPIIILGICILYLLATVTGLDLKPVSIQWLMGSSILVEAVVFGILFYQKKIKAGDLIWVLILAGIILRVGYMLYTPCNYRSHDLWRFDIESSGHAGYLLNLIQNHTLPATNERQYYQQPFFYVLGSLFSVILNGIMGRKGEYDLVNAAKVVSCIASSISLVYVLPLCDELGLKDKGKVLAVLSAGFLPAVIYSSGMVCPDALTTLFYTLTLYYTLRWRKERCFPFTILLAVLYGLAIQTKVSCGLMALFTAYVFIEALFTRKPGEDSNHKKKTPSEIFRSNIKDLGIKYAVFSVIAFPLGLWYCIRNKILFNQSFTYVLELNKDGDLYTGNYSLLKRFLLVPVSNLIQTPFGDTYEDYNFPLFMIKSSLFGEWNIDTSLPEVHLRIMLALVILISFMAVASLVYVMIKGDYKLRFVAAFAVAMIGSAAFFYIRYPFGCSMDFRYYIFLAPLFGIFMGKALEDCKIKWMRYVLVLLPAAFAVCNGVFLMRI